MLNHVFFWRWNHRCLLININPMHPHYGPFLCRMCECGLHSVLWSHIGILMWFLAAEPRRPHDVYWPQFHMTAWLYWPQCHITAWLSVSVGRSCRPCIRWCGTGGFKEQCHRFFISQGWRLLFVFYCFPFILFLFICWHWNAGVFGLKRCKSL